MAVCAHVLQPPGKELSNPASPARPSAAITATPSPPYRRPSSLSRTAALTRKQVIGEMEKALQARGIGPDEIAVRGSSHFGGHKYAGVLIIYPQGDW